MAVRLILALVGLSLGLVRIVAQTTDSSLQIDHRVLFMTSSKITDAAKGFIEDVILGYDVPYDKVDWDVSPPEDLEAFLWQEKGRWARYSTVIMYPNVEALGLLSRDGTIYLGSFLADTGARLVKWGAWPSDMGYAPVASSDCTSAPQQMALSPEAPLGLSGVKRDAALNADGVRRCPGIETQPQTKTCLYFKSGAAETICSALAGPPTPIVRLAAAPALGASYAAPTVAGALLRYSDGRQVMAFNLECSDYYISCFVLSHLALSWALQDLIPGRRHVLLSLQVDDIFLPTQIFNKAEIYRISASDLQAHAAWQRDLSGRLPAGSVIKLDLAFNGNGILERSGSRHSVIDTPPCREQPDYEKLGCSCAGKSYADCPASAPEFCRNCTKDWRKPSGDFGVDVAPPDVTGWRALDFASKDDLYRLVSGSSEIRNSFYWVPHSFSHQNLDNVTANTIRVQMRLERRMSGKDFLNIYARPTFSRRSIITTEISGIFNGDALTTLHKQGVNAVVGDNTWPQLRDRTFPNHALLSSKEINGYSGMMIMPRWATQISYDSTTAADFLNSYNARYPPSKGAPPRVFRDVIASDARDAVRKGLMTLRLDGFMFHQGNLRVTPSTAAAAAGGASKNATAATAAAAAGGGKSLIMSWVEAVMSELGSVVAWPVRSLKLDDLQELYRRHTDRDKCQLSYTLTVTPAGGAATAAGRIERVTVRSGASGKGAGKPCYALLTMRPGAAASALDRRGREAVSEEALGGEPPVMSVRVRRGGSVAVTVAGDYPWGAAAGGDGR